MKRRIYICAFLAFVLLATAMLHGCSGEEGTSLGKEIIKEDDNVLYVTDSEAAIEHIDEYIAVLNNDGIIVVTRDSDNPIWLDEMLGMPISLAAMDNAYVEDAGEDIATLYYEYGAGLNGMYIINVGEQVSNDKAFLINEAIAFIRDCQSSVEEEPELFETPDQDKDTGLPLGAITVAVSREPKGKLVSHFEVFTVQEYNERDYYIVKSTVTGYPGCCLADSDAAYGSSYQGEGMEVSYSTPSSSTTVDTYGPTGTVTSGSYSVDLGVSFHPEDLFTWNWGLSYTRDFLDTTISCTGSTTERTWDVTIRSSAQKQIAMFEPGVTFVCPSTKGYIDIDIYGAYDLDSWNTAVETISFNRTMRCSGADAELTN